MKSFYCIRCRKHTRNIGRPKSYQLSGGRVRLQVECANCHNQKSTFTSKRKLGLY